VARRYDYEDLAGQLFLILEAEPDGMDKRQIAAKLSVPVRVVVKIIRKLRLILGAGDSINVPWRADGRRRVYFLAGQVDLGQQWQGARIAKKLADLEIDLAWWRSMVEATDGRTLDGKRARLALRHQQRLFEDISSDPGSETG
jgi:hypothetical protein